MPIDYSKWKAIEVSDDEDDTHPNIDNASLFRWRHQARVERMEKMNQEKQKLLKEKQEAEEKLKKLKDVDPSAPAVEEAKVRLDEVSKKFQKVELEEKQQPWNVDTISKPKWEKTIINNPVKVDKAPLTEEEKERRYNEFVKKHESNIKRFGMLSKWEDCKKFLMDEPNLCCEETANYLTLWCLNLEIEGKSNLMEHVAKQAISMQYMLELAKQLDVDARGCISSFFTKIQKAEQQYIDVFNEEVESFKNRIRERARIRIEASTREVEEEERKKRLGPGGLDPLEVFETLPKQLQECFESKDIPMLQKVISEMDVDDAKYHMKRCVDSGLWVPDAKDGETTSGDHYEELKASKTA